MAPLYTVRQFARLSRVTIKALHHYERLGLIKPRRSDAGYRRYTSADLARIEQIVSLKLLGLPLKQIKRLLDGPDMPLPDALRRQRELLEHKRRSLDRSIRAIRQAEVQLAPGAMPDAVILHSLFEVLTMTDDWEPLRVYFSDAAWPAARLAYEQWPWDEWDALYRDIGGRAPKDLTPAEARALSARWLQLFNANVTDSAVRDGLRKAWGDTANWPPALRQRFKDGHVFEVTSVIGEAIWAAHEQNVDSGSRAPDRASPSRVSAFHAIQRVLETDPASADARRLVADWDHLVDFEAGGDPVAKSRLLNAWSMRQRWPQAMRRYVATLYDTTPELWERTAAFIETARRPITTEVTGVTEA